MPHVAVIGAGPAGLFAAEQLAKNGIKVTVYDHKPSPARKFLMAGRGGLNITHSEPFADFLSRYGEAAEFLRPALERFTPQQMRDWCAGLGEDTFIGSSGRIFPKSFKASPLLRAWLGRLDRSGVIFHFNHRWAGFDADGGLRFATPEGPATLHPDAVLLALGGASWPRLGSDGGWTDPIKSKNIAIKPFEPANCGFRVDWSDMLKEKHAGMPLKSIALTFGEKTIRGELMITKNGVEGGGIYALSADIRRALNAHGPTTLHLDLKPDCTQAQLTDMLRKPMKRDSLSNHLRKKTGLSAAAIGVLQEDRSLRSYTPEKLAGKIKNFPLTLIAPFGIDRAISSAGGIARTEIDEHYMLRKLPGVFVAGEMIDWEAPTGGYLLQASFATAQEAATGILRFLK